MQAPSRGAARQADPGDSGPNVIYNRLSDRLNRYRGAASTCAVIGGGIIGCGVARDAALRGLRVALVEKRDFGSGTTAASTRIVHGGLRYLEMLDFRLVRLDLRERETLLRIAPHLVQAARVPDSVLRATAAPPPQDAAGPGALRRAELRQEAAVAALAAGARGASRRSRRSIGQTSPAPRPTTMRASTRPSGWRSRICSMRTSTARASFNYCEAASISVAAERCDRARARRLRRRRGESDRRARGRERHRRMVRDGRPRP